MFAAKAIIPVAFKVVVPDLIASNGPLWPCWAGEPKLVSNVTWNVVVSSFVIVIVSAFWKLPVIFSICKYCKDVLNLNIVAVAPEVSPVTVAVPEPCVAIEFSKSETVAPPMKAAAWYFNIKPLVWTLTGVSSSAVPVATQAFSPYAWEQFRPLINPPDSQKIAFSA